jgi:hypothetical protein
MDYKNPVEKSAGFFFYEMNGQEIFTGHYFTAFVGG